MIHSSAFDIELGLCWIWMLKRDERYLLTKSFYKKINQRILVHSPSQDPIENRRDRSQCDLTMHPISDTTW